METIDQYLARMSHILVAQYQKDRSGSNQELLCHCTYTSLHYHTLDNNLSSSHLKATCWALSSPKHHRGLLQVMPSRPVDRAGAGRALPRLVQLVCAHLLTPLLHLGSAIEAAGSLVGFSTTCITSRRSAHNGGSRGADDDKRALTVRYCNPLTRAPLCPGSPLSHVTPAPLDPLCRPRTGSGVIL